VITMARNVATFNGRWGIALFPDSMAVAEPSGNRAWGNGEPEQCLNIECRIPRRHHGHRR
jgi:hypothetical protein